MHIERERRPRGGHENGPQRIVAKLKVGFQLDHCAMFPLFGLSQQLGFSDREGRNRMTVFIGKFATLQYELAT
jgi:hypothetical protein